MKDYVNNDDQFIRKTAILQDKFLDWLDYVLATTWYTFHSRFYIQTDGVAKGGPVSSTTAEIYIYIYMQAYEKLQYWRHCTLQKFGRNLFNDVYSILKRVHLEKVSHNTNNLYQNIKLTMKGESNGEHFITLHWNELLERSLICIGI